MNRIRAWVESVASTIAFDAAALYGAFNHRRLFSMAGHGARHSERLLKKLVRKNRNTVFGKEHHFAKIHSVEDYRELVPYTSYADYQDYIEQTLQTGEQNLITSKTIRSFSNTSGTVGVMKHIPYTSTSNVPYIKAISIALWMVRKELKKRGYKRPHGKGINLVEYHSVKSPSGIRIGYVSGNALLSVRTIAPLITCMPKEFYYEGSETADAKYLQARYALQDPDLEFMFSVFISALTDLMDYIVQNHETLIRDIETGSINPAIEMSEDLRERLQKKLAPDPERARELRHIFQTPHEGPLVPRVWKRMSMIEAIASGEFTPYLVKMRSYTGYDISYNYLIYGSSEALVGTAMKPESDHYLVLPDSGYYEFIAVDDKDEKPLSMDQLKVGHLYEIVITNLAGLWRYRIRDIVRVAGFEGETPYLQFAYRDQQVVNIAGVHLTAEHIAAAAAWLGEDVGETVVDYSFFEDSSVTPARIVFFIEFEHEPQNHELGPLMDKNVDKANSDYGHLQESSKCGPCEVHVLPGGTYARLREKKVQSGIAANQLKSVKLIRSNEQYQMFLDAAQGSK